MYEWLTGFAYHIDLQWWMFVLAGCAAIGIALLTVGMQSMRAALASFVKAIKSKEKL